MSEVILIISFDAPVRKTFYAFLLPLQLSMLSKAFFMILGGMMLGRGAGEFALGAIMMAMPFIAFFAAIMGAIGVGGCTLMGIEKGKNNLAQSQKIFAQSLSIAILFCLILNGGTLLFLDELLTILGAEKELWNASKEYMQIILLFIPFQGMAIALSSFIRNDGNPKITFYSQIISTILGFVLDYIFIFELEMGVRGAAYSASISWFVMFTVLLFHFIQAGHSLRWQFEKIQFQLAKKILHMGLPTFFVDSSSAITGFFFNFTILNLYSPQHMAVFSIVSQIAFATVFILIAYTQTLQPLVSFYFGAKRMQNIYEVFTICIRHSLIVSILIYFGIAFFAKEIASFFISDTHIVEITTIALQIYFISFPFEAYNMMVTTLFQSTKKASTATCISLLRELLFVIVGIYVLPKFFPEQGIWSVMVFSEIITACIAFYLLKQYCKTFYCGVRNECTA